MIGYKLGSYGPNTVLIELEIPEDAKVCRIPKKRGFDSDRYKCDKALVKRITSIDGVHVVKWADSLYPKFNEKTCEYANIHYEVGKMAYPNGFDKKAFGKGIYFFDTKEKAINY